MSLFSKVAFIIGVTGQDGSYLAGLLLEKGCIVYGSGSNLTIAELAATVAQVTGV